MLSMKNCFVCEKKLIKWPLARLQEYTCSTKCKMKRLGILWLKSETPSSMKRPEVVAKVLAAKKITYDLRGRRGKERDSFKKTKEYVAWRKSVFERDNYTCVFCKKRGCEIQADHIKPYSIFPKLRLSLKNGRTLCKECHKKTPTYGRRIHNYKKTLNKI